MEVEEGGRVDLGSFPCFLKITGKTVDEHSAAFPLFSLLLAKGWGKYQLTKPERKNFSKIV